MKCRFCGEELFPNYKGRLNNWKCPGCSRWLIGREIKEAIPVRESGARVEKNIKKEAKSNMVEPKEKLKVEDGWEEKVAGRISFDKVGMEIVGRITDIMPTQMPNAVVNSYTMVTDDGETMGFLGTTVLDRLIGHELNSLVKIKYLGVQKTGGGRNLKTFQVFVRKEEKEAEEPTE